QEAAIILANFLGVSLQSALIARLQGAPLKARTLEALRSLLLRAARLQPLVLVIENMHWVDASSEEFLAEFVRNLSGHRVLLVLSTRPAYEAPWLATVPVHLIALEGLGAEDVQRMIRSL